MIDKFLEKFEEFSSNDKIEDKSEEVKVALFGVYLQALQAIPKAQVPEAAKPQASKINKPHRTATAKQIGFIRSMIKNGKLEADTDTSNLTVGEASALINKGVNSTPSPQPTVTVPEEPEGEFAGSYSHESGGATSQACWWD